MLNSFDGKFSVFLRKLDAANVHGVLLKKWNRYVVISIMILVPCFVEAVQVAAAQDIPELGNSSEVSLKCRLENVTGIGRVGGVAQDCKLIMECFAQPLAGFEEPLFFNRVDRAEVSSGNPNDAADNSASKSGSSFIHFLKLLPYTAAGGLLVTDIGNLLIWLRWR